MRWLNRLLGQKRGTQKNPTGLRCRQCGVRMPESKANRRWGICKSCRRDRSRSAGDYRHAAGPVGKLPMGQPQAVGEHRVTAVAPNGSRDKVTTCSAWKCPNCGEILKKGALGTVFIPGDSIHNILGKGTCLSCGAALSQADIYGGKYDFDPQVAMKQQPKSDFSGDISVLLLMLHSTEPPTDPKGLCREILWKKYPKAKMVSHYIAGQSVSLSVKEAYNVYLRATGKNLK